MSNIASLSAIIMCAALLGAIAGYLFARRRSLFSSLLVSIVGSLISSGSYYALANFDVPQMLLEWAFRMIGA